MNSELIEIGTFTPERGESLEFFFEPRCEAIKFKNNQSVVLYAKCPNGPEVDLPADVARNKNLITVNSQSGNALWYVSASKVTVATLEQAFGKKTSCEIESALLK